MLCTPGNPPTLLRRYTGSQIIITPDVVKSFIKTVQQNGCSTAEVSLYNSKTYISIFRLGDEEVEIAQYNAFELDENNNLGFYWDDVFLLAAAGRYGGDVYINGVYCFSLEFKIPRCKIEVSGSYNVTELQCAVPCEEDCPVTPDGFPGAMPSFAPPTVNESPDQECPVEAIPGDCDAGAECGILACEGSC